jgi:hypothetical protein
VSTQDRSFFEKHPITKIGGVQVTEEIRKIVKEIAPQAFADL